MARGTAVAGGQTGARLDGGRGTIGQAPGRGGGGGGGKGKGKGRGSRGGGRGRGASAAAGSKGGGAGGAGGKGASGVSGVSDAARHAANVRVADRLRSYAAYAVSQPDQQRQDMTLRSAAKGVSAADELVVDAASAQRCRGVGPKLSQRIVAFLDWATAAAAAPPTAVGRWENADESKWWRVEWVAKGDGGSIVRRSYGSLDVPGFEEAFKPFTNAEARETVIQKFVRDKERAERYVRCAADCGDAASIEQVPDRDTAPHEEARTIHEELADLRGDDPLEALAEARERAALRGVARGAAIRGKQYDPRLLNKAGSLQAVSAILVAMHRHRVRHPDDGCMTKDQITEDSQKLCPEIRMAPSNLNSTSFLPGEKYSGISSLSSTLKAQEIVEHWGTKKHFRLTPQPGRGLVAGERLAEKLSREYDAHVGSHDAGSYDAHARRDDGGRGSDGGRGAAAVEGKRPPAADADAGAAKRARPGAPAPTTSKSAQVICIDMSDDDDDLDLVVEPPRPPPPRAAAPPPCAAAPPPRAPLPKAAASSSAAASASAAAPSGAHLARLRLEFGASARAFLDEFDVTLVVDSREKRLRQTHEADAIVGALSGLGGSLRASKRQLQFGDYVWLATPKGRFEAWDVDGLVLGRTIERKCATDFKSTVCGHAHHRKQKLAMKRCPRPTYLVEGEFDGFTDAERQECDFELSRLELLDDFVVHRSTNFDCSVAYLRALDDALRLALRNRNTRDVLGSFDARAYADVAGAIDVTPSKWPLWRRWALALMHVPGVSASQAENVVAAYDTPRKLIDALRSHAAAEPLLTRVLEPGRKLAAQAKRIAAFFLDDEYAQSTI